MNCEQFEALLPRYPDDLTDDAERTAFLLHAAECPACGTMLAEQEALLQALAAVDEDVQMPRAFADGWRQAIRGEKGKARRPWYARWQSWAAAAAAAVFVFGGTALMRAGLLFQDTVPAQTAVSSAYAPVPNEAPMARYDAAMPQMDMEMELMEESAADTATGGTTRQTILLRSASIDLETLSFDTDMDRVKALLEGAGGWVEYQSTYGEPLADNPESGRYAYMRLRVPEAALDGMIADLHGIGVVKSMESTAEDVTDSYYDVQGRLAMYTAQRDRMTELLAKAEDMTDIIEIEGRLSELQYTIESLQGRLNNWDARAQNAMMSVTLTEVAREGEYVRLSLGQRIREGLDQSLLALRAFLADVVVFLVIAVPYLLPLLIIVAVCTGCYRAHQKRKKKEHEKS